MIAWRSLIANLGWIVGAAVLLSAWSLGSYRATCHGATGVLRHNWAVPAFRWALLLGVLMISLSQVLISQALWRQLVWIAVSVLCVVSGVAMIEHLPWSQGGPNDSVGESD